jgi:hypothetical protein
VKLTHAKPEVNPTRPPRSTRPLNGHVGYCFGIGQSFPRKEGPTRSGAIHSTRATTYVVIHTTRGTRPGAIAISRIGAALNGASGHLEELPGTGLEALHLVNTFVGLNAFREVSDGFDAPR